MPLFDFVCRECGNVSELLIVHSTDIPACSTCGSTRMTKKMSAHSSMSGSSKNGMPGPGDTACCGSSPAQAAGCAGPGSCCGKSF